MPKQEILSKLISHYKWCIENMPDEGFIEFLYEQNVHLGICHCIASHLKIYVATGKWINKYGIIWFPYPLVATCPTEAKQLLQKRVEIMEKEILIIE